MQLVDAVVIVFCAGVLAHEAVILMCLIRVQARSHRELGLKYGYGCPRGLGLPFPI